MNVKKIIKSVIGFGVMSVATYAAYKIGESDGRANEIRRRMTEIGDEDDFEYDEPDDGCIAPYSVD